MDELIAAAVSKVERMPGDADGERARRRAEAVRAMDERLVTIVKRGVDALLDKKAEKLVVLKLEELTAMSDYFVLASATNERQAQALSDAIEEALKKEGRRPNSIEGYERAAWILLDYGDVVFHVFHDEARRFYGLARLWGDAPDLTRDFQGA
jgi:ribosome-associated protein